MVRPVRFRTNLKPYSTTRVFSAYQYKGQFADSTMYLLDYGSRRYDPELGHFIQPDSIVPNGVQGYDRYGYVFNNPVRYNDPSGHRPIEGCGEDGTRACHASDLEKALNAQKLKELDYDPTGQKQKRNQEIAEAILYDGTEFIASVLFEPADWAITINDCANGNCSFLALGFMVLPSVSGRMGRYADNLIVYRGLAKGEEPASGLIARAPGFGNDPISHVAGKRTSQWISTTRSEAIATIFGGKNGVVAIDLSRVTTEIVDYSNGIPGKNGTMLSNWARKFHEVLVLDYIPSEAIVWFKQGD
jgi:RHS repeat-associated protein